MKSNKNELKISVNHLKIGMFVSKLDKSWSKTSFTTHGFFIENSMQILKLSQKCQFVYINTEKTPAALYQKFIHKKEDESHLNLQGVFKILAQELKASVSKKEPLNKEDEANLAVNEISEFTHNVMETVQVGGSLNIFIAEQHIRECIHSIHKSSDAIMLSSHLKLKHRSIWQHSMNVSIFAIKLGQYLNFNEDAQVLIGLCGLFHDIGSLLISKEMLAETKNKIELIASHTLLGHDILLGSDSPWSKTVAEVAYNHHEFLNGTGFPRGLKGDQISTYTRMITIVDMYDNFTNTVSKDEVITHYQAMEKLQKQKDKHLDAELVESFNQCLGTYPVGSVVKMNTGETALVVGENPQNKLKPKVRLLSKSGKLTPSSRLIDLADESFQSADCLYEIQHIVRDGK